MRKAGSRSKHSPSIAALVVRLTGLGGGSGGCLACCAGINPWVEDWVKEDARGTLATADGAIRMVFAVAPGTEDDGELEEPEVENEVAGLWTGVCGMTSVPHSAVELISHLGVIMVCLGGRGSRRVSLSVSRSGI